jgi:uncharacterized membrane protein YozB (DUF420 family)
MIILVSLFLHLIAMAIALSLGLRGASWIGIRKPTEAEKSYGRWMLVAWAIFTISGMWVIVDHYGA